MCNIDITALQTCISTSDVLDIPFSASDANNANVSRSALGRFKFPDPTQTLNAKNLRAPRIAAHSLLLLTSAAGWLTSHIVDYVETTYCQPWCFNNSAPSSAATSDIDGMIGSNGANCGTRREREIRRHKPI